MNTITIRRAARNDAAAITDILITSQWFTYDKLYSKDYITKLIDQYYSVQRIEQEIVSINEQWHGYFIAESNGKIVGAIGGGMTSKTAGEVYVFYLDPLMRGMGIGTRLLDFFTKIQKYTYGANEQWVSVAKGNHYGIPFYEARGFIFQHEELAYGTSKEDQDISLKYKRDIT
ncbi:MULTISPECIES: GNAT family N-acetyltransferase [Sporosarcina]|uniref:Ribosomal protein S18 acetylase RimI-like enzyme n=1 Tax=Sporosarcina psychrophila TaxID=1476 RepID=A0ABV2KDU2_SPOPS|nr:GNAT family N-acetyltransferase [Sporosarcina sp. resist]QNK89664.1 GNAT family N-acetyltransferase [Sporosarcina sp. resist]